MVIGLEASFRAVFSLITAKVMLILISVPFSMIGGILSAFKIQKLIRAAEKCDDIAIKFAVAPFKIVLLTAICIYWVRFFHLSMDAVMIAGGWVLFGVILFETTDRVLVRKIVETDNSNSKSIIESYQSVRFLLIATMISGFAYSAGIATERQAKRNEARILSEKLEMPGIVFGAGDIGLLIYVPGELIETRAGGYLEKREPSAWYLLPFNGDPLELR